MPELTLEEVKQAVEAIRDLTYEDYVRNILYVNDDLDVVENFIDSLIDFIKEEEYESSSTDSFL